MFRRVSRCARGSGLGWRVYPPRGDSARTGQIPRRHKNDEYAAVTRGRPAFQRHESRTEGSDTAPHAGTPKKHCVQEGTARIHRRRAPTLRKPFFLLKQPRAGLFQQKKRLSQSGCSAPMDACCSLLHTVLFWRSCMGGGITTLGARFMPLKRWTPAGHGGVFVVFMPSRNLPRAG